MTVEQVLQETHKWPRGQVDELIKALIQPSQEPKSQAPQAPSDSLREYFRKLDELWAGSDISYSKEEIVEMIRRSRG